MGGKPSAKFLEDSWRHREAQFFVCLFVFFRAALVANGSSQARGQIGAVAAGLRHSHSQVGDLHCSSGQQWILNPLSEARD